MIALGIGLAWPRERLLTEAASPVAEIDTGPEQFAWISADQLVIVFTERQGDENRENGDPIPWHGWADLLNVTTRKRERLTAFTEMLNIIEHLQWLPDGKQISFLHRGKLYVMSAKPDR